MAGNLTCATVTGNCHASLMIVGALCCNTCLRHPLHGAMLFHFLPFARPESLMECGQTLSYSVRTLNALLEQCGGVGYSLYMWLVYLSSLSGTDICLLNIQIYCWQTDQLPGTEPSLRMATREVSRLLWNLKIHYRFQNTGPCPELLHSVHILTPHLCKISFNIILSSTSRSPFGLLPSGFPKIILYLFLFYHT